MWVLVVSKLDCRAISRIERSIGKSSAISLMARTLGIAVKVMDMPWCPLRLTETLELMIRISATPSQVSSQRYQHGTEGRLAILTVTSDSRRVRQRPSNIHAPEREPHESAHQMAILVRPHPPLAEPRRSRSRYDGCHFLAVCTATANPRARQQSLCWHRGFLDSSGDILRWPAVDAGRRVSCQAPDSPKPDGTCICPQGCAAAARLVRRHPHRLGSTKLRIITKYAEDEQNTRTRTVLVMMVGGSKFAGIHGKHFAPGISIRFAAADSKRQTIPWVEYRDATTGKVTTFVSEGTTPDSIKSLPIYEMQCVDCHNRPTHTFESASQGLDEALILGDVPAGLPFIKKKGVELLTANYKSSGEAAEKLPSALVSFYRQNYADVV